MVEETVFQLILLEYYDDNFTYVHATAIIYVLEQSKNMIVSEFGHNHILSLF